MKYIYVVVRFNVHYVEAMTRHAAEEKADYTARRLAEKNGVKYKSSRKPLKKRTKAELLDHIKKMSHSNPSSVGYFPSWAAARKAIQKYPENLEECGYYDYVAIEEVPFGCVDAFGWDIEFWRSTKGKKAKYVPCKRPAWSVGVCSYSS